MKSRRSLESWKRRGFFAAADQTTETLTAQSRFNLVTNVFALRFF